MDFELTSDQQLLRDTVREFARAEIAPVAEQLDRDHEFPYEIVRKLGELDLMGIPFPEEYGGAGGSTPDYALVVEELTRVDSSVAITLCAHTSLGTQPLYLFGSEEQKQRYMPRLCSGEMLGAFGLTEPEAGSDAGNTQTRARLEDGEWVINGTKQFITNAGTDISGLVVITAVTGDGEGEGRREISNILVENGTPGYEPGPQYRKMGWHASDTRPLSSATAACPRRTSSAGAAAACRSSSRCSTSAASASPRWESGSRRARSMRRSPTPSSAAPSASTISSFQTIQAKLANLATEIEACRLLVQKAAWLKDERQELLAGRRPGQAQERPPGRARRR